MPTNLENFTRRTQEIIHEWANIWNEAGLQQRGIQKATIINAIRGFQGCQPFPQNAQPRSDSIFYIVDTRNIEAQQIVQNIVDTLQRTYAQREVPTLERVYVWLLKENYLESY
ncbi:hypothetical protein C2G38_2213726 [Gigaspora rosea]|uniref:Uncharacterized protein n=1 Tax=Gigaspora rosea TaxID=44941 RepID=A0A397UET5_9GLOM|nr:hypothetical protein C2G38_2213726 [Gigaspora rosea]